MNLLHTQCVGTKLCIRSRLLCELTASQLVALATRSDTGSHSKQTMYVMGIYHDGQFYCQRKSEKTTDLPQVICKLYDIILYQVYRAMAGFELTTSVMIPTLSAQLVENQTTIRSRPRRPPFILSTNRQDMSVIID